ncbi:uncharacterized protein LOC117917737 [Vitis riparia]|uniref:uncharacterized protein LOC117917733 n=1 Tax=Vitis riparia TaxID=96939 RepID=UPI00155B135B|nr:uncharacterized protein LOC117917733 [Vitis riparia]XP_034689999.1 uncharacterized protein LOC117917737 [Vitis riparia]
MSTATPPKTCPSQLVVLNKAFKLAEQWVKNMSTPLEDEPTEVKLEARPSRLGLGAKVSRQSKIGPSNDPIERKLYAKLDAGKRKSSKSSKESTLSARNGSDNSDDSDEDLESRTKSFSKKRVVPPTSSLQRNKKSK